MHGKQVTEVSKGAIYRKLAKVGYCMSLKEVMEFSLIKLGTYIKLCECGYATNTLNSKALIQNDIDMLEECAHRNPHFCQHAKIAKICAVCDTGAVSSLSASSSSGKRLGIFQPGEKTTSGRPNIPPSLQCQGDHKMVEPQLSVLNAVEKTGLN